MDGRERARRDLGARGLLSGIKRTLLSGESFFQNTYTARDGRATVGFGPGQPGYIHAYEMDGGELLLERGAYLASMTGVETNADFQGLRGLFNEGLFVLKLSGSGLVFFNAYGDIQEIEVDGSYVIDNGHAVAWEPSLENRLTRAGRIRSFLFSDQIIMEFSGRGKLWVQSRNPRSLADWVYPFRPFSPNQTADGRSLFRRKRVGDLRSGASRSSAWRPGVATLPEPRAFAILPCRRRPRRVESLGL